MKSTETTYHASMHRRRPQGGFTLVELLVVVVILGILSAVVVFAVRGAGDKGEASARATDERTIRTAEEAFCASVGSYGTEKQLAGIDLAPDGQRYKFLSEESKYHDIRAAREGEPKPCNGTGYVLEDVEAGENEEETLPEPGPGSFSAIDPPPFDDREVAELVALADGRILAYSGDLFASTPTKAALYNPAQNVWAAATAPPPFTDASDAHGVLLVDDPGTLLNDCGIRCGQVLVHSYTQWLRFVPVGPGAWEPILAPAYSKGSFAVNGAVLLLDDPATSGIIECEPRCGKIFITAVPESSETPSADLYDPLTDSFERINFPAGLEHTLARARSLTRLKDGRVLMVENSSVPPFAPVAFLFDPRDKSFSEVAAPPDLTLAVKFGMQGTGTTLPNGDVLLGPDLVFSPAPRGSGQAGQWTKVGTCSVGSGQSCTFLAALPDGTVLAQVFNGTTSTGQTRRFDPSSRKWFRSADVLNLDSVGPYMSPHAFLERGCGLNCGKVLLARRTAELYTP